VAEREPRTPDTEVAVTPAELRAPNLSLQPLGYSRAETHRLLERAAGTLEDETSSLQTQISDLNKALDEAHQRLAAEASREPVSMEEAVGEVLVTAHRAAELVRKEADQEVDALLVDARARALKIVEEAERQAEELDAAKARAEDALAKTEAEARAVREDAEREVAKLHAEARRVRLVIDEFRNQWWELISEALKQLELRVPSADAPVEEAETLHDDLRSRLAETEDEDTAREKAKEEHADSEVAPRGERGSR
jgi:cell division septum initiation protein DivIVA